MAKGKIRKKIKKAVKAVATGGLSLAASAVKKKVAKTKVAKKIKKALKQPVAKLTAKASPLAAVKARKVIKQVKEKTAGDCQCKDEMAKLVAAKLVAELGPPLNKANQILARMELRRQATYEHRKLMSDADFRRRVLEHIADKARNGNRSCQRTLKFLSR